MTTVRTRHLVFSLALFASLAAPCYAADSPAAQSAFVAELAHKALLSANDKTLTSTARRQRLEGLLDADFDMPRIAGFVLGRRWLQASDTERQQFTAVFRDFMVRTYAQRFTQYNDDSFRIVGQREESPTSTMVYTEISRAASGQPVKLEWRVADRNGYKIVDMNVAGVSMALTQREEFAAVLQRNGGDLPSLIRQLEVKMSAQQ
jgi:phospholipid transport system substrate-binding protein